MKDNAQHVTRRVNGTWAVRASGALRAARVFSSQAKAIQFAKSRAVGIIYVHGKNGMIVRRELPLAPTQSFAAK